MALIVTIIIATLLSKKKNGIAITDDDLEKSENKKLPNIWAALCGPILVIILLALRPISDISVNMPISERMKLIPYEALIGLTSTLAAIAVYFIMG